LAFDSNSAGILLGKYCLRTGSKTKDPKPKTNPVFESEEQRQRAELIVSLLAKLYVVLELSPDACPVCGKTLTHDSECPIQLAWTLLDERQQNDARTAIRALALSIGCDESIADPLTH
jgi:hypothetical protein